MSDSLATHWRFAKEHWRARDSKRAKPSARKIAKMLEALALADDFLGLLGQDPKRGIRTFIRAAYKGVAPTSPAHPKP